MMVKRKRFTTKDPGVAREVVQNVFSDDTVQKHFNIETFQRMVSDMRNGRLPRKRTTH